MQNLPRTILLLLITQSLVLTQTTASKTEASKKKASSVPKYYFDKRDRLKIYDLNPKYDQWIVKTDKTIDPKFNEIAKFQVDPDDLPFKSRIEKVYRSRAIARFKTLIGSSAVNDEPFRKKMTGDCKNYMEKYSQDHYEITYVFNNDLKRYFGECHLYKIKEALFEQKRTHDGKKLEKKLVELKIDVEKALRQDLEADGFKISGVDKGDKKVEDDKKKQEDKEKKEKKGDKK